jgi:multidrug resistance efflux pump
MARMKAELEAAEYDLDRTTVRAPSDGIVTQMRLRKGVMAAALPLRPVMTFIPDEGSYFAGAFWQNSMLRLKKGDHAEIILDALPGRIFQAHVDQLLPVMGEGELQSAGTLARTDIFKGKGRPVVVLKFDDDLSEYNLPRGVQGEVAIYTEHLHHVAIIRKILLRMKSWQNYVFGEGH